MIVADSNLIAYLLIPGDHTALAESIFLRDHQWAVPSVCRSELRNILTLCMRHQKMPLSQALAIMDQAEEIWSGREYTVPHSDILELTHQHKITAYEAEFVVLATQLGVTLITFDKDVRKTFPRIAPDPEKYLTE
ncbi:type II toxin-antitoxin system VapC family toxin [Kamptonema cortianum]|nr:type II toxin-antitoxin system VapC family toxin [Kamptonema cortianum]MDL5048202.1 type II toxin-antitoxin system VapC family toxin [Oscillatoria amoena NRMC-F 0135]MDL5053095.1 type II toxin-antitoxin system VapC family toxin [Oscillatoria laete-virens NRMC-F 0139]